MPKNERLKILFLPAWYPSEKNPVAGIFIKEYAKAVSLYNEVVVLYSEGNNRKLKKIWDTISDKSEDSIRTIRIQHRSFFIPKVTYLLYLLSIKKTFRKLLKENWMPNIIHVHVYSVGVPAIILGKIYKIPVVITEHFSAFSRHALARTEAIKAKLVMNKADIILPVSKNLQKAIKSYGIKNKFQIIPNVINTKIFSLPSLRQSKKVHKKKRILTVALLSPSKGISYLLKSLAQLKQKRQDFSLDIVGNGGPYRKKYEELTKRLELNEIVNFHGLKTRREVARFMKNCDFFVQASLWETFGISYIEAMACGKPVVATNLPALREIINKERGILVPTKNPSALTEAVNYMLDHYQEYSSEKSSRYAKERFSYESVGRSLDKIYKKIV